MKYFILSLLALSCVANNKVMTKVIHSGVAYSISYNDLNVQEMDRVLGKLDEQCGETWCRGGPVYHFAHGGRITCDWNNGRCFLSSKVFMPNGSKTYRSCQIEDLWRFRDLMGRNGDLDEIFLARVMRCVIDWENGDKR